jgi:tetratricopeptide (TPR) repeat protein
VLLEQAGRAAWLEADADGARERLEAAIALHAAGGRQHAAARASGVIVDILWQSDQLEQAVEVAERAYADLTEDADRAAMAALLGKLRSFRTQAVGTLEATQRALEIAEPLELWDTVADALITRGAMLVWMARPEEGHALLRHGTELAVAHDLPTAALRGYNNLAWIAELRDRLSEAEEYLEQCIDLARARGDRVWLRALRASQAAILGQRGRWDDAERVAGTSPEDALAESLVMESDILAPLATIRAARGDREGLAVLQRQARAGLRSADDQVREICLIAEALTLAGSGAHAQALEALVPLARGTLAVYRHYALLGALESAVAVGREDVIEDMVAMVRALPAAAATPTIRAHGDRFEALLSGRGGDVGGADRLLTRAASLLAGVVRPFERAKVLLDHGELLAGSARSSEAQPLLREAADVFAALRAEPWRLRAERALEGEGAATR